MSFVSSLVSGALSRVVGGASLPFTLGEKVEGYDNFIWTLFKGTKKVRFFRFSFYFY